MKNRLVLLAAVAAALISAQTKDEVLPNGWSVRPAGRQVALDTFPMASAVSPDGKYLLALHAGLNPPSISVLDAAAGKEISRTPVADAWLGLTFAPKGNLVYVGGGAQAAVYELKFDNGRLTPSRTFPVAEPLKRTNRDFIGDVTFSPDGRLLYAAELYQNSIAVINPQSGRVIERFKTGRRPYRILFAPDGRTFFVSCWADGMVLQHDTATGNVASKYLLAPHPTDMVWVDGQPKPGLEGESNPYVARIFVTTSNTNSVRVLGVTGAGEIRTSETINLGLSPLQPAGMTPSALTFASGLGRVYVACSDENAVAVLDVTETQSRILGYLPAARYPTSVRVLGGGRLAVLNGGSNSASFLESPTAEQLETYTATVRENSPYRDRKLDDAGTEQGGPIPSWPGDPSAIRRVVYVVINEGWTYDQAFGQSNMPNLRKLAKEFVLLDNFRVNGETLADGYNWSVAAISPDYVQKMWPASAAKRRDRQDFEEPEPAAVPPAGYLWTNARMAKVPVAVYTASRSSREQAEALLKDVAALEQSGEMPRLSFVRFTSASAAENDSALGALVTGLSKSRFWPDMAIVVVVAHTGHGPDKIDPHRAPALVVSPFVKRGTVDSTLYNTTSVLRTVELLLGLQPMTQFDAAAKPMSGFFQAKPDNAPYVAAGAPR